MFRALLIALVTVSVPLAGGVAQHRVSMQPGTLIRFSFSELSDPTGVTEPMSGTLLDFSDGVMAVAIQGRAKTLLIPATSMVQLEYLPPQRPLVVQGAKVGFLIGALMGTVMNSGTFDGDCFIHVGGGVSCPVVGGVMGGIGGTVVGIVLGFVLGELFPDSWQSFPTGPVNIPLNRIP